MADAVIIATGGFRDLTNSGAGEVTWQSGGYSQSVVFGRISGQEAAAYIQGN